MSMKPRLRPGPDHPITIEPAGGRVRVTWEGHTAADTEGALVLREASYPPVYYVPLLDVNHAVLQPSSHQTYCPYKGDASYYSLSDGEHVAQDAVWFYAEPYDDVAEIAGFVAFYPQHVEISPS